MSLFPNSRRKMAADFVALSLSFVALYFAAQWMLHISQLAHKQREAYDAQQETERLTTCRQMATDYARVRDELARCQSRAASDLATCNRTHP